MSAMLKIANRTLAAIAGWWPKGSSEIQEKKIPSCRQTLSDLKPVPRKVSPVSLTAALMSALFLSAADDGSIASAPSPRRPPCSKRVCAHRANSTPRYASSLSTPPRSPGLLLPPALCWHLSPFSWAGVLAFRQALRLWGSEALRLWSWLTFLLSCRLTWQLLTFRVY